MHPVPTLTMAALLLFLPVASAVPLSAGACAPGDLLSLCAGGGAEVAQDRLIEEPDDDVWNDEVVCQRGLGVDPSTGRAVTVVRCCAYANGSPVATSCWETYATLA